MTSIFQRPFWVSVFALTAAIVWGWAYPLIKLGFAEFCITPEMTASKMLFAGVRFFFSGLIILVVARKTNRNFRFKNHKYQSSKRSDSQTLSLTYERPINLPISQTSLRLKNWLYILVFALLNTTFHYAFFYFGLSHSAGARAAILNSLSVFSVVILACLFFKSDKMTVRKIVGCIVGFSGILALNLGGEESGKFTVLGDGMIILNALCSAFAALMTRGLNKRIDVFVGTGYALSVGGFLLVVPGILFGGVLPVVTPCGIIILLLLICISTIGFTLYNKLLTCNPVGKVAIYNSLIPVVGAVTSCFCLNEVFFWKYVVAGALATIGIYIINKGKK